MLKGQKIGTGKCVYLQGKSYVARIWHNGKRYYLGSFTHEKAALVAIKNFKIKHNYVSNGT